MSHAFPSVATPDPRAVDPAEPWPAGFDAVALRRLRELDTSGEGRLVVRVLRAFEGSLLRLVPQLVAARAAGEAAGIRHVAHTLKSSSASVGALALASICSELEAVLRDGTGAPLAPLLDAFEAEAQAVLRGLRPWLEAAA